MISNSPALCGRVWNGATINQRIGDGYVCASQMCKANNREWFTYARSDRTKEYIAALAADTGIPATHAQGSTGIPADRAGSPQFCGDLVQVIKTGPNEQRGTWVHPRLAIDLARWISPQFAVKMDAWFIDWMQSQQQPASHASAWAEPEQTEEVLWANYLKIHQQRFDNASKALQLSFVLLSLVDRVDAGQADQRTIDLIAHGSAILFSHFRLTARTLAVNTGDEPIHRLSVEIINTVQYGPRYHRPVELPPVPTPADLRKRRPRSTV